PHARTSRLATVNATATPAARTPAAPAPAPRYQTPDAPHEFTFTRAIYSSSSRRRWRGGRSWATDYPKADRQFILLIQRLVGFDIAPDENAIRLDDPELRRYPFLYAVEVGRMSLTEAEVEGLRSYLLAGGFLVVDDFWGSDEWANFEREIRRVLPEYPIVDLPPDHPIYGTFYEIEEVLQVPNIGNAIRGRRTWERDGYVPIVRGIHDAEGRLMVLINWNTDLGDAWEWAEHPGYPLRYSSYAYELGTNMILYGMSR
ncbi:MAG TPA: DUF4159 domain-containing protein, partial [Longimicrobiales bacterium]